MRCWAAFAGAMVLASSSMVLAKDSNSQAVYCTQSANGEWSLHRFKPLIKVNGGTVFAEMRFAESALEEFRLRRFYKDSELALDYRFDVLGSYQNGHSPQYTYRIGFDGLLGASVNSLRFSKKKKIINDY